MRPTYTVSWFSAGASSAVATRLAIDEIDEVIYTHIDDQHPDTMRFVKDCEAWFGKPVTILQSPYENVENVSRMYGGYISGMRPRCTDMLKRRVRKEWESDHQDCDLTYIWGMDAQETGRAERIPVAMPKQQHRFPLIEEALSKQQAHEILRASGIKRPAMYELGYFNNNCVGCVKGWYGYWNKIRVDFPEVFAARAKMERDIGGTILRDTDRTPLYLDELDPERGRDQEPIMDDCGIMCELQAIEPLQS